MTNYILKQYKTSFFNASFLLDDENNLIKTFLQNKTQLNLYYIYIAVVVEKLPSIDLYIVKINNHNAILKHSKKLHIGKKILVQIITEAQYNKAAKCSLLIKYISIDYINDLKTNINFINNDKIKQISYDDILKIQFKYYTYNIKKSSYKDLLIYKENILANHININEYTNIDIISTHAFTYLDVNFKGNTNAIKKDINIASYKKMMSYLEIKNISGQILIDLLKDGMNITSYNEIKQITHEYNKINGNKIKLLGQSKMGLLEIIKTKQQNSYINMINTLDFKIFQNIIHIHNTLNKNPLQNITLIANKQHMQIIKKIANVDIEQLQNRYLCKINYLIDDTVTDITTKIS